MAEGNDPRPEAGARALVVTRLVDAPRARVVRAWTAPAHLRRWWGPRGWTLTVCTLDLRPGGVWHSGLRGPGGEESWGRAVYREIVPPERLVYTDRFSDAAGKLVEPTRYGLSPGFPKEALVTVTFEEHDGQTRLTLRLAVGTGPEAEREAVQQGWGETLDRLAEALADDGREGPATVVT
jgi:uncharacterized protein YndB with AHSA1/START domain